jgi:hypothetical protein
LEQECVERGVIGVAWPVAWQLSVSLVASAEKRRQAFGRDAEDLESTLLVVERLACHVTKEVAQRRHEDGEEIDDGHPHAHEEPGIAVTFQRQVVQRRVRVKINDGAGCSEI